VLGREVSFVGAERKTLPLKREGGKVLFPYLARKCQVGQSPRVWLRPIEVERRDLFHLGRAMEIEMVRRVVRGPSVVCVPPCPDWGVVPRENPPQSLVVRRVGLCEVGPIHWMHVASLVGMKRAFYARQRLHLVRGHLRQFVGQCCICMYVCRQADEEKGGQVDRQVTF
jgi:hypothetical protein